MPIFIGLSPDPIQDKPRSFFVWIAGHQAELVHEFFRVFGEHGHLPLVRFRLAVALEAVLVAALLLAHLAVPAQLLQALGLDAVGDGLGREEPLLLLTHLGSLKGGVLTAPASPEGASPGGWGCAAPGEDNQRLDFLKE